MSCLVSIKKHSRRFLCQKGKAGEDGVYLELDGLEVSWDLCRL
jgi:hypothetical protein